MIKKKKNVIIDAFEKIREEEKLEKVHKRYISEFADLFISCSLKNARTKHIVEIVQMHRHTKACRKYCSKCRFFYPRFPALRTLVSVPFNQTEGTPEEQLERLEKSKLILKHVQNVLEDEETMDKLTEIGVEEINEYVKLQIIVGAVENLVETAREKKLKNVIPEQEIQEYLRDYDFIDETSQQIEIVTLQKHLNDLKQLLEISEKEIEDIERNRLQALLDEAGVKSDTDKSALKIYEEALGISNSGYKIIHKRDINEIFVNNYNPEWIINWNGNMDLQLCLDYYAVITYISDYYSKDDSGTMGHIKNVLKNAQNESLKTKLKLVMNTFLTHRQIGECEAYFKILPHLQMKSSNIETVFIQTGFKKNRSTFLKQLTENEAKFCKNIITVNDKKGLFMEKPSLLDKYERKDLTKNKLIQGLTYPQFCMKYSSTNKEPTETDFLSQKFERGKPGFEIDNSLDLIVTHDFDALDEHYSLPNFIRLNDVRPGEPKYMKRCKRHVARFHKFNQTKNPHEFYYSQLQMFHPFKSEQELAPDDIDKCLMLYMNKSSHNGCLRIENVQNILFKHLVSVENGTERAEEMLKSRIGDVMDPEFEQDNDNCEDVGPSEHPDFTFKDPSDLDVINPQVKRGLIMQNHL